MKRLLLINFCNGLYGGIESFLLNAFYCLDQKEYDVTFLTCGKSTYGMFKTRIESLGGHVDEIPILAASITSKIKLYSALKTYFRITKPDIVHINSGTLTLHLLASEAARAEKISKVIVHAHNFLPNHSLKEKTKIIIKNRIACNATDYLACSSEAALWIFPKQLVHDNKVKIIPNGVDTNRFLFSQNKRDLFRNELDLDNSLVIGNIGRFQGQKNHGFMIKIMDKVVKVCPDAKLLLVGEGNLKNAIQELVRRKNLEDNVLFLGERKDMDAFLSAIDVFILPSLYEGLPIAAVEAQAAGTRVLLSDTISRETNVAGSVIYLPINHPGDEDIWCSNICNELIKIDRALENQRVYDAGFDVNTSYKSLIDIYNEESSNDHHG